MRYVFHIVPSSSGPYSVVVLVVVLVACVTLVIGYAAWGGRHATFEVSPEALTIRGDMFGRRIPATLLRVDSIRSVDLRRDEAFVPRRRTFGTGLPGYLAGWFRLQSGERALVFLTDRTRAVWMPTRSDYGVLISVEDPGAFVRRAHEVWGSKDAPRQ
ncbi:MAG TPA: PH domain-containing protein [Gemmatimonadales bacterium]|nr:PH domain-containing protein [Gemmatimonadales bacterium]